MILKKIRDFMSRRTITANVRNAAMNNFSNYETFKQIQSKAELLRIEEGRPHEVLYFHKVDDPYSHLTIHTIDQLKSTYDIVFKPVLVGNNVSEAVHEPYHYKDYCLRDAVRIAPFYNISFESKKYPNQYLINKANNILTGVSDEKFYEIAMKVSSALWNNNESVLNELSIHFPASAKDTLKKINEGNKIRNDKNYYFGSAFYYEKELYWGIDRLHYLEKRLTKLGLKKIINDEYIYPLILSAPKNISSNTKINLTYYPSLNSPYTFISAKRVKQLRDDYPINLITKPVLPMLMRKYAISANKAKYIISDAAREGRTHNSEIKKIYSPIGKPARTAFSLFPLIDNAGKGFEYIDELLKASFQDGINIGDYDYLKKLVTNLGLDWDNIKQDLNTKKWKKILNDNVDDMFKGDCWGVPSFKITNEDGTDPYYVWGQDRMWLLKEEINKRLS